MKKNILVILMFHFAILKIALAQNSQFPSLWNVQIHSTITYNTSERMFYYVYMLTNDLSNTGSIGELEIDISSNSTMIEIDTVGLRFENDGFTEGSFRRHFPILKGKIVPVGFLISPGGTWTGGLSDYLVASFSGTSSYTIKPGQSSNAFELMSKGLPVIRRCVISPDFDFDSLFSEERFPNEEVLSPHFTDSVQNAGKFYGLTVGPTAPPINFISTEWCDTLTNYTTQSRTLGWIKDQTTANKYLAYFSSAKAKLVQHDSVGARAVLLQILRDVDIDSASTPATQTAGKLTSEAYALLRFNTEYLLSQLPAPLLSYTLVVNTFGKGTVAINPNQTEYDNTSVVQLTAVPSLWYFAFNNWSGDVSSSVNPLSITMNSNKAITTTFLEISISSAIDSLIAFKHRAQSNSWIGDDNFIKELDNGLDNAKKHLAKIDSINCNKEVTKFQDKVQKEYEKTQDNAKKNKPKDKRFVTEEGYNLLYNNVQYIIDRLPMKK